MKKVNGIKNVVIKVIAEGEGVVNWNGVMPLRNILDDNVYENHTLPKLKGFSPYTGKVTENGYAWRKYTTDIDFKENPMYISQNCIRHHMFKDHAYDLGFADVQKHMTAIIASLTGLLRGYVVAKPGFKRTSPLLVEDFVDQYGNGTFEQMGQCGSKQKVENKDGKLVSSSIFSKTTFGKTRYLAYISINIEELQFICLDQKYDRAATVVDLNGGEEISKAIVEFLKSLDDTKNPQAVYHPNYVRKGTILHQGEMGILLNQDAISILVEETIDIVRNLFIKQGKGYMQVEELKIDYNESNRPLRIKKDENSINEAPTCDYAIYYDAE